jgi:hypothetical protein
MHFAGLSFHHNLKMHGPSCKIEGSLLLNGSNVSGGWSSVLAFKMRALWFLKPHGATNSGSHSRGPELSEHCYETLY